MPPRIPPILAAAGLAAICAAGLPAAVMADTASQVQDAIVNQLKAQGFTSIHVGRTLLGRVRIDATSDKLSREIVFKPRTGEILRGYWSDIVAPETSTVSSSGSGSSGSDRPGGGSSGSSSSSGTGSNSNHSGNDHSGKDGGKSGGKDDGGKDDGGEDKHDHKGNDGGDS